jgi:hypothetical protein
MWFKRLLENLDLPAGHYLILLLLILIGLVSWKAGFPNAAGLVGMGAGGLMYAMKAAPTRGGQ